MGCAPSSNTRGNRVAVLQQPATTEENNNQRLSMVATNYHNEEIQKPKPLPSDIYGADLNDATVRTSPEPDSDDVPTIYGADLPDRAAIETNNTGEGDTNVRQEIHVPVTTHGNKMVSFGKNEADNTAPPFTPPEKLTVELLNEFIHLDSQIQKLEADHTEEKLTFHQMEYTNIEQALKHKQLELDELKDNMDDKEEDNLNCSLYMQSQNLSILPDENLIRNTEKSGSEESLTYLEGKNKVEVCEKELVVLQDQLHKVSEAVQISLTQVDDLTSKRFMLNGLLENVFNGEYGSDLENRLELETEQLLQYKQHVSVAHFKWWNGRTLINEALTQVAIGCRLWKEIEQCATSTYDEAVKYEKATDTRNNIVAAHQNCVRTEEYLQMQLPYWTIEDNQKMVRSINTIYTDLLSNVCYQQAYSWFYYYHQRLGLQLNWMEQVINNKIVIDYQRVSQEFKVKYRELRKERLGLIQEKAKEILHIDWDIEPYLNPPEEENDDTDILPTVGPNTGYIEEQSTDLSADTVSLPIPVEYPAVITNDNPDDVVTGDGAVNIGENSQSPPIVRRLSLSELAPTPTDNELFGNVKQLELMHRKQMEVFDKVQETNKARQEEGLKEKLRERQSKRRKQQLQQIQETALSTHLHHN